MQSHFDDIYTHPLIEVIHLLYEVADIEFTQKKHYALLAAKKTECTHFEYKMLQIDNDVLGVLNMLSNLKISLSLISHYPSQKIMEHDGYSEKSYAIYHYSVICHCVSTIKDLFLKLTNNVCNCQVKEEHNKISWKELEASLKTESCNQEIIHCLTAFWEFAKPYINDRQKSTHEGRAFNQVFDPFEITNLWSLIAGHTKDKTVLKEHRMFIRGTKENNKCLIETKGHFYALLCIIIEECKSYTTKLFNIFFDIFNNQLNELIQSADLKCYNNLKERSNESIVNYIKYIIDNQLQNYIFV